MTTTRDDRIAGPAGGTAETSRACPEAAPPAPRTAGTTLARELLDGLAEAVVTTDVAGTVVLVNALARELLPEVVVGHPLARCAVPALAEALRQGRSDFDTEHHGRRLVGVGRDLGQGRHAWYVREVTEERACAAALHAERSRTAFLARAGSRLGLSLHREQVLRATVTLPVPYLADAMVVLHRPASPTGDGALNWIRFAVGDTAPVTGPALTGLAATVPGLAAALDGSAVEPLCCCGVEGVHQRALAGLAALLPTDFDRGGTVLVTAIPSLGAPSAVLVTIRRGGRPALDERDVDLVREFSARAGAALATADLHGKQAHLARVLQASLLPPALPAIPGVVLAGGYRAADDSLRIGGDFYGVYRTEGGGTFAIGDVSGRGVGAAVLTGRVRQSLQTLRLVEQRPLALMELLNRTLLDAPDAARRSQLTTLLLGTFHPEPEGTLRLRVAGGGHPAPLVVGRDGTVTPVRVGGMPVGAFTSARYAEVALRLAPGELLLAYTDGVVEARGGPRGFEMFGEARLRQALASGAGLPARTVVDRLLRLVDDWLDGQGQDDIAILAIQAAAPTDAPDPADRSTPAGTPA